MARFDAMRDKLAEYRIKLLVFKHPKIDGHCFRLEIPDRDTPIIFQSLDEIYAFHNGYAAANGCKN